MYKRILVPIDGSHTANLGLKEAIRLAKYGKAAVRLLHVVDQAALVQYPAATLFGAELPAALEKEGERILAKAEAEVRRQGLNVDTVLYKRLARICDVVVQQARKWRADLIVLGTHGRRGVNRLVMGSDAELVVRYAPVPVLLVHAPAPRRARRPRR